MKLASLASNSRDGVLVVVNRDLTQAAKVDGVPTLQIAIENWATIEPQLQIVFDQLQNGTHPNAIPFDVTTCLAPFPRAYQFLDGSVYGKARKTPLFKLGI